MIAFSPRLVPSLHPLDLATSAPDASVAVHAQGSSPSGRPATASPFADLTAVHPLLAALAPIPPRANQGGELARQVGQPTQANESSAAALATRRDTGTSTAAPELPDGGPLPQQRVIRGTDGDDRVVVQPGCRNPLLPAGHSWFGDNENGYWVYINDEPGFFLTDAEMKNTRFELGGGNDTFDGSADRWIGFRVDGGAGDDTLIGGFGNDVLAGGEGNDIIRGGTGNDVLDGGAGNDRLCGDAGDDQLIGGAGNDVLLGGTDHDVLLGGDGNDILDGGWDGDLLDGGAGQDQTVDDDNLGANEVRYDPFDILPVPAFRFGR